MANYRGHGGTQVGGAVPPKKKRVWGPPKKTYRASSGTPASVKDQAVPQAERDRQARVQAERTFDRVRTPQEYRQKNVKATPTPELPKSSGIQLLHRAGLIPDPKDIPGMQRLATETRALTGAFQSAPGGLIDMFLRSAKDVPPLFNFSNADPRRQMDPDEILSGTKQNVRDLYESNKALISDPLRPGNTALFLTGFGRPTSALAASGISRGLAVARTGSLKSALTRPAPPKRMFEVPGEEVLTRDLQAQPGHSFVKNNKGEYVEKPDPYFINADKAQKVLKTTKDGAFQVSKKGRVAVLRSTGHAGPREIPQGERSGGGKRMIREEDGTFTETGGFKNTLVPEVTAPDGFKWAPDPKNPHERFLLVPEKPVGPVGIQAAEGNVLRRTASGRVVEEPAPAPAQGYYSKSKDIEYAQRGIDYLRHRFPDRGFEHGPAALRGLRGRAKWEQQRNAQILEAQRHVNEELKALHPDEEGGYQGDPGMLDAATVEAAFSPDPDMAAIASKYNLDETELFKYADENSERLTGRILSNTEVWKEGHPDYDAARGVHPETTLINAIRNELRTAMRAEIEGFKANKSSPAYWGRGANNFMRLGIFYLAPKYAAPNLLGNAALNFIQQGKSMPKAWKNAAMAIKREGPENLAMIDRIQGLGVAQSIRSPEALLPQAKGALGPTTQALAHGWSKILDTQFRRASWFYEAEKAGFKTAESRKKLLNDPELQNDLIEVTRRAKDEILDYQRLGKLEKSMSEFLFIYPFTKASTVYLGQFMAHHPMKAAAAVFAGQYGEDRTKEMLGDVPSFMAGAVPIKGGATGMQVSSMEAFNPVTPGLQVAQAGVSSLAGSATRREIPVQYLQPALRAALNAAQNYDPFFGRQLDPKQSDIKQFIDQLLGQLPQAQLIEGLKNPTTGNEDVLYPMSRRDAVERFGGGTIIPRPINPAEVRSRASEEARSMMQPMERIQFTYKDKTKSYIEESKKTGLLPKNAGHLTPLIRRAIEDMKARDAFRLNAKEKAGDKFDAKERYAADVDFLVSKKQIPKSTANEWKSYLKTADDEDIKKSSRWLYENYFKPMYGETLNETYNVIRENGGNVDRFQLTVR